MNAPNEFHTGGQRYARFRPTWPDDIARRLAELVPNRELAVDVGCGAGQFTGTLAPLFTRVLGVDPSASQRGAAPQSMPSNVTIAAGDAARFPCDDGSVDLITAAQAAHWFDLNRFYTECRRVARANAVVALLTYGSPCIEVQSCDGDPLRSYQDVVAPWWPDERAHVENGYSELYFPFRELAWDATAMRHTWTAEEVRGYASTWSATKRARRAGLDVDMALNELAERLKGPATIVWPIRARAGRITEDCR